MTNRLTPVQVQGVAGASAVAAGSDHSLALSSGTVRAWGCNSSGQLGIGTMAHHVYAVQVSGLNDVTAIAAGENHSLALAGMGILWAWGANTYGQLGDGTSGNFSRAMPTRFSIARNTQIARCCGC